MLSGNSTRNFHPLHKRVILNVGLLCLEKDGLKKFHDFQSSMLKNNLVMSESSLPSVIEEVVNVMLFRLKEDSITLGLEEFRSLSNKEFGNLRVTRLIADALYSDVG